MIYLDFEQPIENLYSQLDKIKEIEAVGDIDVSDKIIEIEKKIVEKKKEIYENLSGWQRVQLSIH